jgi:DNA-binding response OmpR family regulator
MSEDHSRDRDADDDARPTVLVVEDDPAVARVYARDLSGEYDVRTVETGEAALSAIDGSVDVVLLDRRMPGLSGDEVLSEIRSRGLDCRVAIVSAVDPDFDIIDMGFDAYVTKPPDEGELRATVADLSSRDGYTDRVREFHSLVETRATLRAEKTPGELRASEEFARLEDRIVELRSELSADADRLLSDDELVATLRELEARADAERGPDADADADADGAGTGD